MINENIVGKFGEEKFHRKPGATKIKHTTTKLSSLIILAEFSTHQKPVVFMALLKYLQHKETDLLTNCLALRIMLPW